MKNERKVMVFIAVSLDGYITTEDESLEWLFKVEGEGDNGYSDFYKTVDTLMMGRKTYDWLMNHEHDEFPYEKNSYVFTRSEYADTENVKFINPELPAFIEDLKKQEGKNIWVVGGGQLLYYFFKDKLIDEMIITVAPVVLGKGIPLFHEGDYGLNLSLKNVRRFNQFAELHYEVKKDT